MQFYKCIAKKQTFFMKVIIMRANIKLLDLLACFHLHIEPLSYIFSPESHKIKNLQIKIGFPIFCNQNIFSMT